MSQQIYISVTQDDIDKGERGNSCKCPIALALARSTNGEKVEVCQHFMVFHDFGVRWFTSLLPLEAVRFVENFDDGEPVAPFEFLITFFKQDSLQPTALPDINPT